MNDENGRPPDDGDDRDDELISESGEAITTSGDELLLDAVGAYLLDALPDDERSAFESYLTQSPEAQTEVRELAPVVALLPKLLDLEIQEAGALASPSAELRERIVAGAEEQLIAGLPGEAIASTQKPRTVRTAPEPTDQLAPRRARGRIRSGVDQSPQPSGSAPTPISFVSRFPRQWAAAAALAVVAVGAIIWALALQSNIDNKQRELTAQSTEIAQLRENANATSYSLLGNDGAEEAEGTLLFSLKDQIGVLYVHSLPTLSPDEVYQLWYLDDESDAPKPGGTFTVDENGNGVVAVSSDTPTFDAVALTVEPEGGSQSPTSGILMQGRLGGAAG